MRRGTGGFVREMRDLLKYRALFSELVRMQLKLKYRRSVLGYLWSVLNPLLVMLVLTAVFSTMFARDIANYPVYLLTGQLLFGFMRDATTLSIFSILDNASLIRKVYVPKAVFPLSRVASSMINLGYSMVALLLVMAFTGARFTPYLLLAVSPLVQLWVFSAGLSLLLAAASVFFRDVQYIYSVIVTAWTYLTPLFYSMDALPQGVARAIGLLNPMYQYVEQMRALVLGGHLPPGALVVRGWAFALAALWLGAWVFRRHQDRFIFYV